MVQFTFFSNLTVLGNWVLVESGILKEHNIEVLQDVLCEFLLN